MKVSLVLSPTAAQPGAANRRAALQVATSLRVALASLAAERQAVRRLVTAKGSREVLLMHRKGGIFLVVLTMLSGGCASLKQESGAWREQVNKSVIAIQESVDAVAKAVPGERWARQMEALTHPDPKVRQKALDEIAAGVAASLGKPYRVRAVVGTLDGNAIRAKFFMAPTNQRAELESFCAQGRFISLDTWRNMISRPKTPEEVQAAARSRATELLNLMFGEPKLHIERNSTFPQIEVSSIEWRPSPPLGTLLKASVTPDAKQLAERRDRAIDALTDLISLHYDQIALDNSGDSFSARWSSVEGYGVLHVVLPASELRRLDRIEAWIHEEGKPNERWDNMATRKLTSALFHEVPEEVASQCPVEGEQLRWSAADLAFSVYHSTPSAEVVKNLSKMREAVEKLKDIYDNQSARN